MPAPRRFRIFWRTIALTALIVPPPAGAQEKPALPAVGTIERLDPRFDQIVPAGARVERIAEGFDWAEGPVWNRKTESLLFSDTVRNRVFQWNAKTGTSVFLHPSGYTGKIPRGGEPGSNGLLIGPDGKLVLCQHGDRRVARLEADGSFHTLADRYQGKRFNSPNDGVFKSNGDVYFTDPPYGLVGLSDDPQKELDFCGVYRISAKDGAVTLLTKELTRPNGIAFSPDEKTLYVANSDPEKAIWTAYPVDENGLLGPGKVFADSTKLVATHKGLPDGLKVDQAGNVYATAPGGVFVFTPDGAHIGTFATGEATGNCAWGEDGSTLFITADMYIGRVRLKAKGPGY